MTFFDSLDEKKEDHDEFNDYHYHPHRCLSARTLRIKELRTKFFTTDSGERLPCINPTTNSRITCLNDPAI